MFLVQFVVTGGFFWFAYVFITQDHQVRWGKLLLLFGISLVPRFFIMMWVLFSQWGGEAMAYANLAGTAAMVLIILTGLRFMLNVNKARDSLKIVGLFLVLALGFDGIVSLIAG